MQSDAETNFFNKFDTIPEKETIFLGNKYLLNLTD